MNRDNEALYAAACAIEMQTAMLDVNNRLADLDLPPAQMGIALNTGEVVVGNIGSARRAKYGVVGSPVNLVSRIESYTVGGQILASEDTVRKAGAVLRTGRRLEVSAKGVSQRLGLHEVIGIGAPYDLSLPTPNERMRRLRVPLPCRFTSLDGTRLQGVSTLAEILQLSESRAEMRTDTPLDVLSDIVVSVALKDGLSEREETLYAKVTVMSRADGAVELRFTSHSKGLTAALHSLELQ